MPAQGFTLFDTGIGRCGIAWGPHGILGVQLPEARDSATLARLAKRFPDAAADSPPPSVARAIDAIGALLRGEPADLSGIELDMDGLPPFHRKVYAAARTIPAGKTWSYGDVASHLDAPGSARAVGQALGKNPFAIIVPCHRVLAAGGKVGGFTANGGVLTKLRMLAIESVHGEPKAAAFEGDGVFGFDPAVAVAHLRAADPALARLIDKVGPFGMKLRKTPSLFFALSEAIVYQQLTGRAAATIFARVQALFPWGDGGVTPERLLRLSEAKLRGAGLSRSKLASLRDLAQKSAAGEVPELAELHAMADEAIVERLTAVRGIGRWTAEMVLMFRLGRPDVLPVDDYGVRKGFAAATRKRDLPSPKDLAKHGERWKPYRSAASWYLWRAAEGTKPRTSAKKAKAPKRATSKKAAKR
jgi:methylated-DNA-[protein]-cysteine S-methyltransferase